MSKRACGKIRLAAGSLNTMKEKWPAKKLKDKKTFEEVVHVWLRNEWHYPCYNKFRKSVPLNILSNPNFFDELENKMRFDLLYKNRGHMLKQIPNNTKWYSIEYSKNDIDRTSLIPMRKGWTSKISGGSCWLRDSLNKKSWEVVNKKCKDIIHNIYRSLKNKRRQTELIFLAENNRSFFSVLEGNHRLVAIARKMIKSKKTIKIKAIIGISPKMKKSPLYRSTAKPGLAAGARYFAGRSSFCGR